MFSLSHATILSAVSSVFDAFHGTESPGTIKHKGDLYSAVAYELARKGEAVSYANLHDGAKRKEGTGKNAKTVQDDSPLVLAIQEAIRTSKESMAGDFYFEAGFSDDGAVKRGGVKRVSRKTEAAFEARVKALMSAGLDKENAERFAAKIVNGTPTSEEEEEDTDSERAA